MNAIIQKEIAGLVYSIKTTLRTHKVLINVHPDGQVVVVRSPRISIDRVEKIVSEKLEWIKEQQAHQLQKPRKVLAHYSIKDFKENKENARKLVKERIEELNQFYKYPTGTISIRNQKSRWGSCSRKGNLNFNYKIVFLPQDLCDYIIVHELCHLKELNHGQRFWELVEKKVPDYKKARLQLKKY